MCLDARVMRAEACEQRQEEFFSWTGVKLLDVERKSGEDKEQKSRGETRPIERERQADQRRTKGGALTP